MSYGDAVDEMNSQAAEAWATLDAPQQPSPWDDLCAFSDDEDEKEYREAVAKGHGREAATNIRRARIRTLEARIHARHMRALDREREELAAQEQRQQAEDEVAETRDAFESLAGTDGPMEAQDTRDTEEPAPGGDATVATAAPVPAPDPAAVTVTTPQPVVTPPSPPAPPVSTQPLPAASVGPTDDADANFSDGRDRFGQGRHYDARLGEHPDLPPSMSASGRERTPGRRSRSPSRSTASFQTPATYTEATRGPSPIQFTEPAGISSKFRTQCCPGCKSYFT